MTRPQSNSGIGNVAVGNDHEPTIIWQVRPLLRSVPPTASTVVTSHFNFHIICHHLRSLSQGDLPRDLVVAWNLAVDFLHLGIWL